MFFYLVSWVIHMQWAYPVARAQVFDEGPLDVPFVLVTGLDDTSTIAKIVSATSGVVPLSPDVAKYANGFVNISSSPVPFSDFTKDLWSDTPNQDYLKTGQDFRDQIVREKNLANVRTRLRAGRHANPNMRAFVYDASYPTFGIDNQYPFLHDLIQISTNPIIVLAIKNVPQAVCSGIWAKTGAKQNFENLCKSNLPYLNMLERLLTDTTTIAPGVHMVMVHVDDFSKQPQYVTRYLSDVMPYVLGEEVDKNIVGIPLNGIIDYISITNIWENYNAKISFLENEPTFNHCVDATKSIWIAIKDRFPTLSYSSDVNLLASIQQFNKNVQHNDPNDNETLIIEIGKDGILGEAGVITTWDALYPDESSEDVLIPRLEEISHSLSFFEPYIKTF